MFIVKPRISGIGIDCCTTTQIVFFFVHKYVGSTTSGLFGYVRWNLDLETGYLLF